MSRPRHLIVVGLSALVGLAATSGAVSSPTAFAGPVTSLAVEPGSASVVYAASSEGGVSKSMNGGRTWQRLAVPAGGVTDLVAHPTQPGVLYAAMGGNGVLKTTDGGRSWHAMNTGLRGLRVSVLAIARTKRAVLYAGASEGAPWHNPPTDGDLLRRTAAVVLRSTSGRSWHEVWTSANGDEVRDVAVEPAHPTTIWITTYGFLHKSLDGGRTWQNGAGGCSAHACGLPGPMGIAGPGVPQIAISPRTSRIAYLAAGTGVFRSPDGGRRWTASRLPAKFTTFAFDPVATDSLFVATNRGVYERADDGRGWRAIGRRTKAFSLAIDSDGTTLYVGTRRGVDAYELQ